MSRSLPCSSSALALTSSVLLATAISAQEIKLNGPLARPLGGDILQHDLSPDGTRVVYLSDQLTDGVLELFATKPTPGATPVRLAGPDVSGGNVFQFWMGSEGRRVVFAGDIQVDNVVELFSIPIDGGAVAKLSGAMIAQGDVLIAASSVQIDATETRVVYLADGDLNGVLELYSTPIGGGAPVKLNTPLTGLQDVSSFLISPDGTRVVYRADQDTDNVAELYSVPIAGGVATKLNPAGRPVDAEFLINASTTRAVFAAETGAQNRVQLYSAPLDGHATALPLLPEDVVSATQLRSIPDGSRVVCALVENTPRQSHVAAVALDGSGVLFLDTIPYPEFFGNTFELTPDGDSAVYTAIRPGGPSSLRKAPSDGSSAAAEIAAVGGHQFVLSPDGRCVLFAGAGPLSAPLFSAPLDLSTAPVALAAGVALQFVVTQDGQRVVFVGQPDYPATTRLELFSVPLAGGKSPTKLSAPLPFGGNVESSSARGIRVSALGRVVYIADQNANELFELFSVPVAGGPVLRLSGDMAAGPVEGDVHEHAVTADGKHAVYLADQLLNDRSELFSVRTNTRAEPVRLHGPLAESERILSFSVSPDAATVVYWLMRQQPLEQELRAVPVAGGSSVQLHGPLPGNSGGLLAIDSASARVVFSSSVEGSVSLSSVVLDGSSPAVPLDSGALEWVGPLTLTPDGSRAVYERTGTDGNASLHAVPIDGSASAVQLDGGRRVSSFSLTPDGARVLFIAESATPFQYEAFIAPVDGSAPALVLNPPLPAQGRVVRLAAAGDFAFYVADQDTPGTRELYRVPLDGSATSVKLNAPLVKRGNVFLFEATPDASRVVYHADQEADERWELFSAPADGSGPVVKLNRPVGGGDVSGNTFFDDFYKDVFVLSPDGQSVAFRADPLVRGLHDLFVAPIDGSSLAVRISRAPQEGDTVFSGYRFTPDGGGVVFRASLGWGLGGAIELAVLHSSIHGGRPAKRISGLGTLAALPRHAPPSTLSVLPGSNRVVYRLDSETSDVVELFVSSLTLPHVPQGAPTRSLMRPR